MIKFENFEVVGLDHAIRGMRNPKNSWDKIDSHVVNSVLVEEEVCPGVTTLVYKACDPYISVGKNDYDLMTRLRNAGTDHRKFMRMITVYVDITAPLYWWKEFDTYKVGTVANSCSTMHTIHKKEFTLDDFSHGFLTDDIDNCLTWGLEVFEDNLVLELIIAKLNQNREKFIVTKDMRYWHSMIQLLPTSYNQKRTVMMNYEVLANIYKSRKNHKLHEWRSLCNWASELPYSELITGTEDKS